MACDGGAFDFEAYRLAVDALGLLTCHHALADELVLVEFAEHRQAGLDGGDFGGELVAVEGQTGLEAQCVAASQAARLYAGIHQLLPETAGGLVRGIDLKAVLAGVARARYYHLLVILLDALEGVEREVRSVDAEDIAEGLFGCGTLHGKLAVVVRQVVYLHIVALGGVLYPGKVFGDVAGIDYKEILVFGEAVYQQVVHYSAVGVEHHAVQDIAVADFGDVVGEYVVDEAPGVGAFDVDLAHVADVEHAHALAHGVVLLDNAFVLDGHVKSGKGTHLCVKGQVQVVQTGRLVFVLFHGLVGLCLFC